MEKLIKNLGGHSGCEILLMQREGSFFVRKISSGLDYNERLLAQIQKQKLFSNERIRTPQIYADGVLDNGLVYFDMEYIQGITLAKGIATQNIAQMNDLVERIIGIFDMNTDNVSEYRKIEVFRQKIDDLKNSLAKKESSNIRTAISYLEHVDWRSIPAGKCHGDLTFENIIIRNDHLYVIDFLDSFFESWMMDASTLLQDAMMLWSYKNEKTMDTNLLIKLMVFKDLLESRLKMISPRYIKYIHELLLLKLIRIYPYAKDNFVIDYLESAVGKMMMAVKGDYGVK